MYPWRGGGPCEDLGIYQRSARGYQARGCQRLSGMAKSRSVYPRTITDREGADPPSPFVGTQAITKGCQGLLDVGQEPFYLPLAGAVRRWLNVPTRGAVGIEMVARGYRGLPGPVRQAGQGLAQCTRHSCLRLPRVSRSFKGCQRLPVVARFVRGWQGLEHCTFWVLGCHEVPEHARVSPGGAARGCFNVCKGCPACT